MQEMAKDVDMHLRAQQPDESSLESKRGGKKIYVSRDTKNHKMMLKQSSQERSTDSK
jgi:hypothetical protein